MITEAQRSYNLVPKKSSFSHKSDKKVLGGPKRKVYSKVGIGDADAPHIFLYKDWPTTTWRYSFICQEDLLRSVYIACRKTFLLE